MKRPTKARPARVSGHAAAKTGRPGPATLQILAEQRLLTLAWKETLADLTPGLAHDFNNVLTGILALSETYLAQVDSHHPFFEGLSLIKQKAQEASQLVQRMSRLYQEKTGHRDYQDVNSMVAEVVEILKIVPRRIEVSVKMESDSMPVYVDAVEFRRTLLSLALAAVNSMPAQGKLHFQTSRHDKAPESKGPTSGAWPRMPAICLTLSDSSEGLAPAQIDRLLRSGSMTGDTPVESRLHLQQALAFAEHNGGAFSLESTPGKGTTFRIWLAKANFTEGVLKPARTGKANQRA